jgi:hypothetical protein
MSSCWKRFARQVLSGGKLREAPPKVLPPVCLFDHRLRQSPQTKQPCLFRIDGLLLWKARKSPNKHPLIYPANPSTIHFFFIKWRYLQAAITDTKIMLAQRQHQKAPCNNYRDLDGDNQIYWAKKWNTEDILILIANYEMAFSSRTVMNFFSYCLGNYKRAASENIHVNMDGGHFLLYIKCTFVNIDWQTNGATKSYDTLSHSKFSSGAFYRRTGLRCLSYWLGN